MKLRIYTKTMDEVLAQLVQADKESFCETGSHDDSRRIVVINSEPREPRRQKYLWAGGKGIDVDETFHEPGELPGIETVMSSSILETYAHHGCSARSRSVLKVFFRHTFYSEVNLFWVFDFGEVGEKDSSISPWTSTTFTVEEVLWRSQGKIKLEVTEVAPEAFRFRGASETLYYGPQGHLTSESATRWLHGVVTEAVELKNLQLLVFQRLNPPHRKDEVEIEVWNSTFSRGGLALLLSRIQGQS